jgi:hypothetical protein
MGYQILAHDAFSTGLSLDSLTGYDEDFLLGEGRPLLAEYPKKKPVFPVENVGTARGPKQPDKSNPALVDLFGSLEGPLVSSKKLADLVAKHTKKVELLPVVLGKHKEPYFILNVLSQVTCPGVEEDQPESGKPALVKAMLKSGAIPAGEAMVHVAGSHVYLLRDDLAQAVTDAACIGISLTPLGR